MVTLLSKLISILHKMSLWAASETTKSHMWRWDSKATSACMRVKERMISITGVGGLKTFSHTERCVMVTFTVIHANFPHRISGRCANHITKILSFHVFIFYICENCSCLEFYSISFFFWSKKFCFDKLKAKRKMNLLSPPAATKSLNFDRNVFCLFYR